MPINKFDDAFSFSFLGSLQTVGQAYTVEACMRLERAG